MDEKYYLIDTDLKVQHFASHLSRKGTWWETGFLDKEWDKGQLVGHEEGPTLPITPDGTLRPGILYESSTDPNVRFYLPEYQLNLVSGLYTTRLKWRDKEADPNGPLAFLTLDVLAIVPPSSGFTLQEIPHQTVARLVYQLSVENDEITNEMRPMLSIEIGALNSIGNGVRRAVLPISEKPVFDRLYEIMTDASFRTRLEIHCFAVAGRRTWRHIVHRKFDADLQAEILKNKKILYTDLIGQKVDVTGDQDASVVNRRRIKLAKTSSDKMSWQDALQVAENADISVFNATIRSNDQENIVTRLIRNRVTTVKWLDSDLLKVVSADDWNAGIGLQPSISKNVSLPFSGISNLSSSPVTELRRIPGDTGTVPMPDDPVLRERPKREPQESPTQPQLLGSTLKEDVVEPILLRAYAPSIGQALSTSDVLTKVNAAKYKAVPSRACLDEEGKPALMKVPLETLQVIDPFYFLPATNAYMFDIPDAMHPSDHHVLIRMEVFNGQTKVGVIFKDSAYTDQVYYQPEEFRLSRLDSPPYLPELRILFYELVTQDEEDNSAETNESTTADLNYKVLLTYRAVPYLNPLLLALAQQQLFSEDPNLKQVHFNALAPENTTLSLRVPEDGAETLIDFPRPDVEVRFDQAIVDQFELSDTEFEKIFPLFDSAAGGGIEGVVEAQLLDNQKASVSVHLSFKDTAGSVFRTEYKGADSDGLHKVHLTNRIESPVTLEAIYVVALGPGILARPQDTSGRVVQPGEEFDLFYKVEPANAPVFDISPSLDVSIQVNPKVLWPKLFINQGHSTKTFKVTPTTKAEYFGVVPPNADAPLTGLRVKFDDDTTTTLTAQQLQNEIELPIPLLAYLLSRDSNTSQNSDALKYSYQVMNLLGEDGHEGATSEWMSNEGGSSLTIVPVGA